MTEAKEKLGLSCETLVITMVGRLEQQKNYPMLLEVAKRVISKAPKAHFLVVGKGSQDRALHQLMSDLGLQHAVSFLGQRSDIGDLLAATDISVLTSNYEGLPNVIIEAMGAGKPIVCTEYPGAREIMSDGENALLSPCEDIDMFSHKVLMLIGDPSLRQKLARAAASSAERQFSAGSMARRLESIYLPQNKGPQLCREAGASPARVSEAGNR
jgi:glycosyltransferase involved in cell wall biosynthesis